jgi:hypothetical protein
MLRDFGRRRRGGWGRKRRLIGGGSRRGFGGGVDDGEERRSRARRPTCGAEAEEGEATGVEVFTYQVCSPLDSF